MNNRIDPRRKVGEWMDYTDKGTHAMVPALMKYVRRGEGTYDPTPTDALLGLEKVTVGWTRAVTQLPDNGPLPDDLCKDDDGPDDHTHPSLVVEVTIKGKTEHLMFDIDFAGYM